ncbi:hypothetical protein FB451DRAFT_179317 [Mycena latifolia]|nr:hypothetical protein FB451DRAFT_179317 [Mycena latifolia]
MSGIFSGGGDVGSAVYPGPIIVFDAMAIVASISLALTLAPAAICPNVHRSKAWHSMIATMIFPLFYLLNVGSQFHGEDPPPIGLCILQAGFIYAGPPACTTAVLCFITDRNKFFMSSLIIIPSIIFACVFFEAIVLVNGNRGVHFDSTHMFCESDTKGPQVRISAVLTVISLALTLCMEVWVIVMLCRNWSAVRSIRRTNNELHLAVMVRFGVFTLCGSAWSCNFAEQFVWSYLDHFFGHSAFLGSSCLRYATGHHVCLCLLEIEEEWSTGRSEWRQCSWQRGGRGVNPEQQ